MAFDIGAFAQQLNAVSEPDHGRDQITYIDIGLLDKDEKNFYKLTKLEELASNIQLCGLQQPIRVRKGEGGRYTIVSGHRRHGALKLLIKEGRAEFREVPCIIERGEASEAMRELQLIFANSSTRELSSGDLAKQAERVEMLLYQLKEEGVEFPGRMRDQVAAACKVSSTRVAVWKVIREKLIEGYQALYEKDKITETAAYALARMPAEFQERVLKACKDKVTACYAEAVMGKVNSGKWDYNPCMTCPDGKACTHAAAFIRHDMSSSGWDQCGGQRCCLECDYAQRDWSPCGNMCSKAKDVRSQKAEQKRAKEARATAREKSRRAKENAAVAQRVLRAAEAVGLTDKDSTPGRYSYETWKISDLRAVARCESERSFYSDNDVVPRYADDLVKFAKALSCSTDYLLGLTEELNPTALPEATEPEADAAFWKPLGRGCWPKEGELVLLSCENLMGGYQYQLARCMGGPNDQYPFIDPNDGLSCEEFEDFDCWLPLVERRGGC